MAVILDAMGVMYHHGDDVVSLLIPFLREQGVEADPDQVGELYRQASLGEISAADLWRRLGLDPDVEDMYLARYRLNPGLGEFLDWCAGRHAVWCLSNDLGAWSEKLRNRFGIAGCFRGCVISGTVGVRKPDARIYEILVEQAGCRAQDCVFVDDRGVNLDAARALGFRTLLFSTAGASCPAVHPAIRSFSDLAEFLSHYAGD